MLGNNKNELQKINLSLILSESANSENNPIIEKLVEELKELLSKIDKLTLFISDKSNIDKVGHKHYILLCKQLSYMEGYASILIKRISDLTETK